MKIEKKFYVASQNVVRSDSWRRETLDGAITHARELMRKNDESIMYIVQIVKVVRPRLPDVDIEDVE